MVTYQILEEKINSLISLKEKNKYIFLFIQENIKNLDRNNFLEDNLLGIHPSFKMSAKIMLENVNNRNFE